MCKLATRSNDMLMSGWTSTRRLVSLEGRGGRRDSGGGVQGFVCFDGVLRKISSPGCAAMLQHLAFTEVSGDGRQVGHSAVFRCRMMHMSFVHTTAKSEADKRGGKKRYEEKRSDDAGDVMWGPDERAGRWPYVVMERGGAELQGWMGGGVGC